MRASISFLRYDIHGIVKVDSNVRPEAVAEVLPTFFLSDHRRGKADITIYVGDFIHKNEGLFWCGPFNIGPLKHKFLLKDVERHAKLFFTNPRYNLLGEIIWELQLIFDILELKLLQKGYSFIHAACVERDGEGLMLVAPPDTGKTFTTIRLVKEHGYSYMADDMTIIGPSRTAYCFPKPMTLHTPHVEELPISLPRGLKALIRAREKLRSISWLRKRIPEVRVDFRTILPNARVTKKTRISRLIFLERGKRSVRSISQQEAKSRLMPVAKMHRNIMSLYIALYAYYHPELDLHALLERQDKLYIDLLDGIDYYVVSTPDRSFVDMMAKQGLI